ncbi:hypothetical protein JCM11251_003681 [Rhodosporidiobolus azoricus]
MGTRRDEILQIVDSFASTLRTELSGALAEAQNDRTGRRRQRSSGAVLVANRLSRFMDLPASSSSGQQSGQPGSSPPLSVQRPALGRPNSEIPFSAAASHRTVPFANPSSAPPTPGPSGRRSPIIPPYPDITSNSSVPPNGDALPSYSRRAPVQPDLLQSLPPKRVHLLTSKSGKLALELTARGRDHIVLIQEVPDAATSLNGMLKVNLKDPEGITHIRVRLKGVIRTLVMKAQASGRSPVSDEVVFLSDSQTLWTASLANGAPPESLRGNRSTDPAKLHGTFSFPFSLSVPGKITHLPPASDGLLLHEGQQLGRPIRPPPSFILDSALATMQANISSGMGPRPGALSTADFEASLRYYLKVTLGRKGLLKMNERWLIPVVFVPRQEPPQFSPRRELALREGRRPPGSREDPQGWSSPGKFRVRESVRRGVWKTKSGWVELEGRVTKGKVARGVGERVDFEVHITSSNPQATGRFPPSCMSVSLIQRTTVTAQHLTESIDTPLLRATSVRPIGQESVPLLPADGGGKGLQVSYAGSIKLTASIGSSFAAPNLAVGFLLYINVYLPRSSAQPTSASTLLASLIIPVDIASCAPRPPAIAAASPPDAAPPPVAPGGPVETPPPLWPPTASSSSTAPGAAPSGPDGPSSTQPPLPPRKYPPSASMPTPGGGGREVHIANESAPASANASSTDLSLPHGDAAPARVDEDAERRLEEEWGLPPSYFDVVGAEGDSRR